MSFQFSSKAQTLLSLSKVIKSAEIAPINFFTVKEWALQRDKITQSTMADLKSDLVIVRSSCLREDSSKESNAGAYLSIQNVSHKDLEASIDRVIESYGDEVLDGDEVLVQPMLQDVIAAGVGFSHDPNTCSPYRVISWTESTKTDEITSGCSGRTWYAAASGNVKPPEMIREVPTLLTELCSLVGDLPFDFEFAVTQNPHCDSRTLWLLQLRPLILAKKPETSHVQATRLRIISEKLSKRFKPDPLLKGKRAVFGVMPDWNPAEMLGLRPKPLALSLYSDLITDSIWAYQRHNYGYRNLRSFPLMPNFFGLPYIDARISFNSFVPADLDDNLASKLVDYYIDRLIHRPDFHDKVEFEIVFSCQSLNQKKILQNLKSGGFSDNEIQQIVRSLQNLTNKIINPKNGLYLRDASKIEVLQEKRKIIMTSEADHVHKIYWLLEDVKRYGTLPFAGLARAGFVAVQLLKSLVEAEIVSNNDYDAFMGSFNSLGKQIDSDRMSMSKDLFLSKYGHLRPGSYDITSLRYDEAPDLYFDWASREPVCRDEVNFALTSGQINQINSLIDRTGLQISVSELIGFIRSSIELRESAKFHFSHSLSDALSLVCELGSSYGVRRDDLAFIEVGLFQKAYVGALDLKKAINISIEQGKKAYEESCRLTLPPVIVREEDIWGFEWPQVTPNYVTQKQVSARTAFADQVSDLNGKIICIPNADPGFDWLFSRPIAGLVTAWGGVNSHMAIRAGELGLPAVIGAGELLFQQWSHAPALKIDCAARRVEVLG